MSHMKITLFDQITNFSNIRLAYNKTRAGKFRLRKGAIEFQKNETMNLHLLQDSLLDGSYIPVGYTKFYVLEPKRRLIYAPEYSDKIVQHAINNVLLDYFSPRFIYDSYACLKYKGNERAVLRIQQFLNESKKKYKKSKPYIVKIDIKKFFYTINRDILKSLLINFLDCKNTINLLFKIVDSSPNEKGLPLGNLSSQLLANFYLNQLDQFCKHTLRIKYYVRYADDILIIAKDKEEANYFLNKVKVYLKEILDLDTHETKTKILPIHLGAESLGFKIYPDHILINRQNKNRIKKNIRLLKKRLDKGTINKRQMNQSLNAISDFIKIANSYSYKLNLTKLFPYLSINKKEILEIT